MVLSTICETIEYFVLQDQRKPQRNIQIRTCTAFENAFKVLGNIIEHINYINLNIKALF